MVRRNPYKEPKRIKVGRFRYVVGKDNKPIVGLSWDKGNGQYYPTDWKKLGLEKRPNFGTKYDVAIFNFRQWKLRLQAKTTTFAGLTDYGKDVEYPIHCDRVALEEATNPSPSSVDYRYIRLSIALLFHIIVQSETPE